MSTTEDLNTDELIAALLKLPTQVRVELHKMADLAWTGLSEIRSPTPCSIQAEEERHYEAIAAALLRSLLADDT